MRTSHSPAVIFVVVVHFTTAPLSAQEPVVPKVQPTVTPLSIDLLKAANPAKHSTKGKWEFEGKALVSASSGQSILELPHAVPDEYTLKLQVERTAGSDALGIGLVLADRRCLVVLDAGPNIGYVSGLELIDRKPCANNETTRKGAIFKNGVSSDVHCHVRRDAISVTVDGKTIIDYKGKWGRLTLGDFWKTPNRALFVGAQATSYRISKIELTPLEPDPARPVEKFEGENLEVIRKSRAFPVTRQDMRLFKDDTWSNGFHLVASPEKIGDWIELEFPVRTSAKYRVAVVMTKAADYGVVQIDLVGAPIRAPVDCYVAGKVVRTAPIVLGEADLNAGKARLKITLLGTPKGKLFALDYLSLTALGPTDAQSIALYREMKQREAAEKLAAAQKKEAERLERVRQEQRERMEAEAKAEKERQLALWNNMPGLPGMDGKNHALSDYKKDVVVLCILRTSCPVSEAHREKLIAFAKKYGEKVDFVAVNVGLSNRDEDSLPKVAERARQWEFNFPLLYDEKKMVARSFGAKVTPSFFVFNKERQLIYQGCMAEPAFAPTAFHLNAATEAAIRGELPKVMKTEAKGCPIHYR